MTDTIPDESRELLELIAAQTFEVPDGYECHQQLAGCVRKDQLTEEQQLDLIPLLHRKLVAESSRTCDGPPYISGNVFAADIPHTPRQTFKVIELTGRGRREMKSPAMQASGEPAKRRHTGKPRRGETASHTKIIAALKALLHERGQDDPPNQTAIKEASGVANVSRFICKHWGSDKSFKAAWRRGHVAGKMALIEYQPEHFADLREDHQSDD